MGCDIHVVLGRINLKAIEARRDSPESASTELVLFGPNVKAIQDDFDLEDVPEEVDLDRIYSLFSWLSNVRGSVKPYMAPERLEQVQEGTKQFLDWMGRKKIGERHGLSSYHETMYDRYDLGEHNVTVHLVSQLMAFDYDQIAEVEDRTEGRAWSAPTKYIRPLDGLTYREYLGESFFRLLVYCEEHGHQFIICGFDN